MQSSMTPISTPSPEAMYKKYTDLSTLHDPRVDAVLKRAAMGGDPNYPQVYAIMAIQARTAAKGQAQQMQGAQGAQGPQASVAEKVIAKAEPEAGLSSLPISSDTFHAAGGGMVSFAGGGDMSGRGDMHDSQEHRRLVKKAAEAKAKAKAIAEWSASQTGYRFPSEYVSPAGDGISSPEMNAMIDEARRRQNPQAPEAFSPEQIQALGQTQGVDPNAEAVARTRSMYNVAPPVSEGATAPREVPPEMAAMMDRARAAQNPTRPTAFSPEQQQGIAGAYNRQGAPATSSTAPTAFSSAQQQAIADFYSKQGKQGGLDTLPTATTSAAPTPTVTTPNASDNKGFPPLSPEEKKRIRALSGPKEETAANASDNKGFPPLSPEEKKRIRALSGPKEETAATAPAKKDLGLGGLSKDNKQEVAPTYESMLADIQKSNPDKDIFSEFTNKIKQRMDADKDSDDKFKYGLLPILVGAEMMAGTSQFAMVNIGNALKTGAAAQIQEIQRKDKLSREDNRDLTDLRKFQATMDKGDRDTAFKMFDNHLGRLSEEKRAKLVSDTAILVGQGHDATQRAIFSIDRPENAAQKTAADYLTSREGIRDAQLAALPPIPGDEKRNAQIAAAIERRREARERSRAPSTAPSTAPSKNTYSDKDIAYTAKMRNMTEAEVRRQLGIQ